MQIETYTYLYLPCLALFVGTLGMLELGRRLRMRRGDVPGGVSAIDGAMLGLMGLMIAFTFSGAMGRFESRRDLVVQEANAIGTAWLRLAALPEAAQPALRERFRAYVESRLEVYRRMPNEASVREALAASGVIQQQIWDLAVAATNAPDQQRLVVLVLPALNEMIDLTSTRTAAMLFHPPVAVFGMLFGVILIAALLAGYDIGARINASVVHGTVFALIATITVYVILDIEYGRMGLIRVDAADQFLVDVLASMK